MKKVKMKDISPIPESQLAEWKKLIAESKKVIAQRDKYKWKLIFIAGRIVTAYGEERIDRWAEEIGLDRRTAYEYRWVYNKGCNEAFVEKWNDLSYSVIRAVLRHTGNASNPATERFLEIAREHKMSVRMLESYMMETIAPNLNKTTIAEEIKLTLQDKQEREGFSDYVKYKLEEMVEEYPELEELVARTAITSVDTIEDLKVAAGIETDDEIDLVASADRFLGKLKRHLRWYLDNKNELGQNIAYGHEKSEDLKFTISRLKGVMEDLLGVEVDEPLDPDSVPENVVEFRERIEKSK